YAPPLPPHSTLLAWTEADGQFHRSGREDVEVRAVGSQLLWQLAHEGRADGDGRDRQEVTAELITSQRPVFLDQEETPGLPRRLSVRAARSFCRSESAVLRPRGSRRDALTRGLHTVLRRRGVAFEDPPTPLFDPPRPVLGSRRPPRAHLGLRQRHAELGARVLAPLRPAPLGRPAQPGAGAPGR